MDTNHRSTLTPLPTPLPEGLGMNNGEVRFKITPEIHYVMLIYYELGILPVIVLNPRILGAWKGLSLKGLILCGSVFLKWDGFKLVEISDLELESLGFKLPQSLKKSIQTNLNHFEEHQCNTVASYVETVPSYTMREIDNNCFEFSTPKTKWIVLGSQNMVVVNRKESNPKFPRKCLNSLRDILTWASEIDDYLLKSVGIPMTLTVDIKQHFGLSDSDMVYVYFGVMIVFLCTDMTKKSPLVRCLKGAAFIIAVGRFCWPKLSSLPPRYLLCMSLCMCAVLVVRNFV